MNYGAYLGLGRRFIPLVLAAAAVLVCTSANRFNPQWLAPSGQVKADQAMFGDQPLKVCALTFDDGPDAEYTAQVLGILDSYGIKATFFVIGKNVAEHPELVRALVRSGHEIGNHSYSHPDMSRQGQADRLSQLTSTNDALATLGIKPQWFRPPFGHYSRALVDQARSQGMETILWSVDTKDWTLPGAQTITQCALNQVCPGAVILMHSTNEQTVAALPAIIEGLAGRGYVFATMSQWRDLISGSAELQRQGLLEYPPGLNGPLSPMSDPFYTPYGADTGTPVAQIAQEAAATIADAEPAPAEPVSVEPPTAPAAEALSVYTNFASVAEMDSVLAGGRGQQLHSYPAQTVSIAAAPERMVKAMVQSQDAVEVQDTPVMPAGELLTLPEGEELVLPPTAPEQQLPPAPAEPDEEAPIHQQWPTLPLQVSDLVDMGNSATLWTPPAAISAAELLDHSAVARGELGLAEPRFYFLAMVADLERYTWVELATYVRLSRLSGMVLPSEHYFGSAPADAPYPWVFTPLSHTDRGAWVDLTVEDVADVMEVLRRGKRNVYVVVRPCNLHFFIAAHTWSEMDTNMSDFVLLRQATGGLSYDPDAQLPPDWTLPAGVEVGYFTNGTRDVLVIYSQSYRSVQVDIPPQLKHFSRMFIDVGGYLKIAPLGADHVTVDRSPAVLIYEYPSR